MKELYGTIQEFPALHANFGNINIVNVEGEKVTEETEDYTKKLGELGEVITELEIELEGKAIAGDYKSGYDDGYEAGKVDGKNEGLEEGFTNGYAEGYENGVASVPDYMVSRAEGTMTEYSSDKVTKVGSYAFSNMQTLKTVNFPNVASIENNAFQACVSLSELNFPKCTNVGARAFESCLEIKRANLPVLESVSQEAFMNCRTMEEIYAPMVLTIGAMGFYWCEKLTKMDFTRLEKIGRSSFSSTGIATLIIRKTDGICTLENKNAFTGSPIEQRTGYVYVPDELVEQYKAATNWSTYAAQIKPLSELEG